MSTGSDVTVFQTKKANVPSDMRYFLSESGDPGDCIFTVVGVVLDPVEPHVHGFGAVQSGRVAGEARHCGDDGRRCLG